MPRGKYDVIIFGATSFVGGILTRYIAAQYGWNKDLKWAIAGRSERKLQQVLGRRHAKLEDRTGAAKRHHIAFPNRAKLLADTESKGADARQLGQLGGGRQVAPRIHGVGQCRQGVE